MGQEGRLNNQEGRLNIIVLGRIGAPFGLKGWVHFQSYTDPAENILAYPIWQVRMGPKQAWESKRVIEARAHGKHFAALLEGCQDRDEAQRYTNAEIGIPREALPDLDVGEYYWTDLIGLTVTNEEGTTLGKVKDLFETGANDVLVVQGQEKEHWIPYIPEEYILSVDQVNKTMTVHWDPEF